MDCRRGSSDRSLGYRSSSSLAAAVVYYIIYIRAVCSPRVDAGLRPPAPAVVFRYRVYILYSLSLSTHSTYTKAQRRSHSPCNSHPHTHAHHRLVLSHLCVFTYHIPPPSSVVNKIGLRNQFGVTPVRRRQRTTDVQVGVRPNSNGTRGSFPSTECIICIPPLV